MNLKEFVIYKMNWQNMPEETVEEAITIMTNMHNNIVEKVFEDEDLSEIFLEKMYLWSYNSDYLFSLLSEDMSVCHPLTNEDDKFNRLFLSLRAEIEECLRNGFSVREAIAEWWK